MEILTNIPLTSTESKLYKKFTTLSVNENPLPQGDAVIKISPFDDYFIFTLFDEINGEDKPIDLSNVGSLYISFIGENDEIRIPYYINVQNIDMSQGQVLFRISKDNSKKILALDNDNFYISSQMMSPDGSVSDETVLYTGKFKALDKEVQEALTTKLENAALIYAKDLAALNDQISKLQQENTSLKSTNDQLNLTIQQLRSSNQQLSNELANVSANMPEFSDPKKALQESAELQSKTEIKKAKTITNSNNITNSNTKAVTKAVTKINAKNLEKYF
jgi:cell division protein FtsB